MACLIYYHCDRDGCARCVTVEVDSTVVEILGHVGEGFVAEMTLVKGICSVGLPTIRQEKKVELIGKKEGSGLFTEITTVKNKQTKINRSVSNSMYKLFLCCCLDPPTKKTCR